MDSGQIENDAFESAISLELDRLPSDIRRPVRHATAGGKRLRPRLVMAFAEACGARRESALRYGVAVELIHKASLIQDDLPCMDSASERNGRPALHRVCSPAEAVLASDAMIAHAFRICAESSSPAAAVRVLSEAIIELAHGQALDLQPEGPATAEEWRSVSDAKTGALFIASAQLGRLVLGRDTSRLEPIAARFGRALGRLYQWYDDVTDGDRCHLTTVMVAGELASMRDSLAELPVPAPLEVFLDMLTSLTAASTDPAAGSQRQRADSSLRR